MDRYNTHRILGILVITSFLAACSTPAVYRPEVNEFNKAAVEVHALLKAKQTKVGAVRNSLRTKKLTRTRPVISLSGGCSTAIRQYLELKSAVKLANDCDLKFNSDPDLEQLFRSASAFENAVEFSNTVEAYSVALQKVATSGDKASLQEATSQLGDAVVSLAGKAARAAGKQVPDANVFTPITRLIGQGAFYTLENKRAEALKKAAKTAHPWIVAGSKAIVGVLYNAEFEIAQAKKDALIKQIDIVNEARPKKYVSAVDKAIKQSTELRQLLKIDPALSIKKLPAVHMKLLEAFKDKKRNLASSIAASKDLFKAAKAAREALKAQ